MEITSTIKLIKKLVRSPDNKEAVKSKMLQSCETSPEGISQCGAFTLSVSTSKIAFITIINAKIKNTKAKPRAVIIIDLNFPNASIYPITTQTPAENSSSKRIRVSDPLILFIRHKYQH